MKTLKRPDRSQANGRLAWHSQNALRQRARAEIAGLGQRALEWVPPRMCQCGNLLSRADEGQCTACRDEAFQLWRSNHPKELPCKFQMSL